MTSWIKVQDKLPRFCVDILFTDGKKIYKGWLETYEPLEEPLFYNDTSRRSEEHWPEGISHWMALPPLPGE
jgi:hypothetical protein